MPYILWDWNGTLLDDTQAALDALNAMLAKRGGRLIDMGFYRDHFAFPVRPFYESIGIALAHEDWDALAREYHELYAARPKRLNPEAIAALEMVRAAGVGQSIVSALRQDLLDAATAAFGVASFMDFVYGVDNLDGASKLDRAVALASSLTRGFAGPEPLRMTLIGDSLHDQEVAAAIGARCVLCAQGSHADWRLRRAAPTGATLIEAVELALRDDEERRRC